MRNTYARRRLTLALLISGSGLLMVSCRSQGAGGPASPAASTLRNVYRDTPSSRAEAICNESADARRDVRDRAGWLANLDGPAAASAGSVAQPLTTDLGALKLAYRSGAAQPVAGAVSKLLDDLRRLVAEVGSAAPADQRKLALQLIEDVNDLDGACGAS